MNLLTSHPLYVYELVSFLYELVSIWGMNLLSLGMYLLTFPFLWLHSQGTFAAYAHALQAFRYSTFPMTACPAGSPLAAPTEQGS